MRKTVLCVKFSKIDHGVRLSYPLRTAVAGVTCRSSGLPPKLKRCDAPVSPRRVKPIRKNVTRQYLRYCAWGCFRDLSLPTTTTGRVHAPQAGAKAPRQPTPTDDLKNWSEREDLNLRPLVSQTSALTGLRHAPNVVPLARIAALRKASQAIFAPNHFRAKSFGVSAQSPGTDRKDDEKAPQPSFSA